MPQHLRQRVVIVGAGGFGREIFALLQAVNELRSATYEVIGFVDDGRPDEDRLGRLGAVVLGDIDSVASLDAGYVIGVGDPRARRRIDDRLVAGGAIPANPVQHPSAWIGPDVEFGVGTVICAGVRVTTNVRAGRHVHVNLNATIGHDASLGDYVTMAPLSALSGNTTLDSGVELGSGVSVLPGVRIGEGTTVGAGATVTRDLPPGVVAVGTPAKPRPTD